MVAKVLFFNESMYGQPLQDALEGMTWYAGGDRLSRFQKMKYVIDHPGTFMVDGDDFIVHLKNGKILAGDYSAFESSIRKSDHQLFWRYLEQCFKSADLNFIENIGTAIEVADLVTGIGVLKRHWLQGVSSGRPTTHTLESIVNYANLNKANKSNVQTLVRDVTSYGRLIREDAQYCSENWAFLSKLACDGTRIFGSVVRGLWGLTVPEDPPGLDFKRLGNEYWTVRAIAILANSVMNPIWDKLMKVVYDKVGDELADSVSTMSKRKLIKEAVAKMDKSRAFSRGEKPGGIIERKSIGFSIDALADGKDFHPMEAHG
jgi:hypothetical protein